jgi:DHA2 family multidrug resistance protein
MASSYIVSDLGGSNDIATYSVTLYCMGNTWGIPLAQPISSRIGIVKTMVLCLLFLAGFSLLSLFMPNYPLFLTTRFFQGIVAGPLYFVVSSLLFSQGVLVNKKNLSAGIATMFTSVPVIAASWGGWLAYDGNWRWIFIINIPLLLLLAGFLWNSLKEVNILCKRESFNFISYFFYAIGILSLGLVVIIGQEMDWYRSPIIIALTIVGVVFFLFYLLWDWNHEMHLFELKLLLNKTFSYALINLAVLFSSYFGMVLLLALWLNLYVNYTPVWIGVLLATMAFAAFVPYFLIKGRLGGRDTRIPLSIAIVLLGFSCYYTTFFSEYVDFRRIAFSRIIAGFGLVFFLPPIFRICFHTFPEEKFPKVISLFQVFRAFFSGMGASVYTTIWLRRRVFFRERMGEEFTSFSTLTDNYFQDSKGFGLKGLAADEQLELFLDRSATALALDDTFYLMTLMIGSLIIVLFFTFFLKRRSFNPELVQEENGQGS